MNTTNLLEMALLHNGMKVGKSAPRTIEGWALSSLPVAVQSKRKGKSMLTVVILFVIAICFFASGYAPATEAWVYRKMDEHLLIPRKEPFTALYYEYYDDLPTIYIPGDTVSFTFTIKNAEGFDKEYAYDIYVINAASRKKITLDKGKAFVKNEESQTITKSYSFAQDYGQEAIFVELPESGQNIHFILTSDQK